jgi:hypothetical protein
MSSPPTGGPGATASRAARPNRPPVNQDPSRTSDPDVPMAGHVRHAPPVPPAPSGPSTAERGGPTPRPRQSVDSAATGPAGSDRCWTCGASACGAVSHTAVHVAAASRILRGQRRQDAVRGAVPYTAPTILPPRPVYVPRTSSSGRLTRAPAGPISIGRAPTSPLSPHRVLHSGRPAGPGTAGAVKPRAPSDATSSTSSRRARV